MADELNDAIIARLMAEEFGGDQDYEERMDDSDDPDYGEERKKKAKKGGKKGRGAAKKGAATAGAPAAAQPATNPAQGPPVQPAVQPMQQLSGAVASQQQQWQGLPQGLTAQQQQLAAAAAAGGTALASAPGQAFPQGPTMFQNDVPGAAGMQLPAGAFALPPGISMQQAALMGAFPLGLPMPMALPVGAAPKPAGQAQQQGAALQQPVAAATAVTGGKGEGEDVAELTATGRRKRKDTGKQRQHSRSWSEEEERLFLEALQLHGRDWKKCAEHVGTRDHRAFTSHAQKHFIKLLLRGEEVPPKVAETGRGYTLSGKPLDPNSSSAAAYGLKPELFEAVCRSGRLEMGVHVTTFEMSEQAGGSRRAPKAQKGTSPADSGPQVKRQRKGKVRQQEEFGEEEDTDEEDAEMAAAMAASAAAVPGARTEYARSRPRRELGQRTRLGETTESLELTSLQEFVGPPGTGAPAAQPFAVTLDSQALLVADFHAHLSRCEVIGLLGGTFDAERRVMEIKEAYPCRRVAGSDSSTSVELDAESQVEATSAMEERGLVPVGWYHSHPIFEPRPSAKDNENQRNYQALCRDGSTGLEPWVGLIVGPYDQALETPASRSQVWVVKMHNGELTPFNVRHGVRVAMPAEDVQEKLTEALEQLQEDVGRVDLSEHWRNYSYLLGGQPQGDALTCIQKLQASLAQHLPKDQPQAVAAFLDGVIRSIDTTWGVNLLKPAAAAPAAAAVMPPAAVAVAAAIAQHAAAAAAASLQSKPEPVAAPAGPLAGMPAVPAGMVLPIVGPPLASTEATVKAEGPAAAEGGGAPASMAAGVLLPGGMSALLAGSVGDGGGLVITAAHHQLLVKNEPVALSAPGQH